MNMNPQTNYYEVLGVSENASQEDIKRAYRKLAKENHPDSRGGDKVAEEKFKKISEAYSVLGNKQKRQQYDMVRKGGFMGGPGGFNFPGGGGGNNYRVRYGEDVVDNLQDIFGNLFDGFNGSNRGPQGDFGNVNFDNLFNSGGRQNPTEKGNDMQSTITIPFELAVNGGETIIKTGNNKRVKIKIPAGIIDGKKIRIKGHGSVSPTTQKAGDLYLTIRISPHLEFERKGLDIYSNVFINIAEAILGTEVQVKTIGGKFIKLKIPAGTSSGKVFRLPDMGVKADQQQGDHYVRIEVEVPTNLTAGQKREFKAWAKKLGMIQK